MIVTILFIQDKELQARMRELKNENKNLQAKCKQLESELKKASKVGIGPEAEVRAIVSYI